MLKRLFKDAEYAATVVATNVLLGLAMFIGIPSLCMSFGNPAINFLVALLGGACGWIAGIFAAPYTQREASRFVTLGQALATFLSGYVLSKLDQFMAASLYVKKLPLLEGWVRIGIFVASALITAILIYTNRPYYGQQRQEAEKRRLEAEHEKQALAGRQPGSPPAPTNALSG